jgi:TPR repeat protein
MALDAGGIPDDAITSFELYILTKPSEKDLVQAKAKITEIQAKIELADKKTQELYTVLSSGLAACHDGRYAQAMESFRKVVDQGPPDDKYTLAAECGIGWLYSDGKGVVKDDVEAAKWFRKAAEQGNADAECNLGVAYANGQGVAQDYAEALKWLKRAVEQGEPGAMGALGGMYQNGHGVAKDMKEAVKWYRQAAQKGDEYAKKNLANLGVKE